MARQDDIITLRQRAYRLGEELGRSAYGVVRRAAALDDGAPAAVKLINRDQMERADPALQARWIASADKETAFLRALAPWDERHIVRLLDSGSHQGLPVLALELMAGDLGTAAAEAPPLAKVLAWIGQLNQALARVHQYGWLYLDLKPGNVLRTPDGQGVKLADFGTSRLRSELAPGSYAGTASWQAPEQFFPGARGSYDTATGTDYFALGAMLYYLVTGGMQLRFCTLCGDAYRLHQLQAPAAVRAAYAGRIPDTLTDEESMLFAQCVARQDGATAPALALLHALLDPCCSERPVHALQISRMLAAILPAPATRRPPREVARSARIEPRWSCA